MKKLWNILKCILGFGSIKDGSICQASRRTGMEFHDYPVDKGGDGIPSHFYTYHCSRCSKPFTI